MKTIHYILYVALASLLFTACQEEDFSSGAKGGIRISLTEEVGVDVSTRSTPEELGKPVASQFKFKITDSEGQKKTYNYTDEVIQLSAGTYDVVAYCGDIATTVALDAPYYEGTEEATVEEGKTTKVTLSCKVANALLSIRINEDDKEKFEAAFATPSFQLTVGGKSVATSDLAKSFYFPAGSTISKLAFSSEGSDSEHQNLGIKDWPKEIKAADHIIVTVGMEPAPSGVSLTVEKMEVQTVTIKETIPMEWLPKPKVEAEGFDGNALTFTETETPNAKLNLSLASAMQDMRLKFNFGDAQFTSLNRDTGYLWSNDADKQVINEQLGINVSAESVDLNGLLAKLQTNAGESTTNTIEVDVKANNRWSSDTKEGEEAPNLKYTITCNKPQFSIAVQPGNVWTKTFTIDEPTVTAGNAEVLKEKLVYQYKEKGADDNAWQTCNGRLEQVFSEAPTNKAYQVRALYREGIASNVVDIELETPAQLPNSDMEDWWIETKTAGSLITKKTYYTFHPYAEKEGNSSWWDTNNDKAQGGTVALGIWYEGCFASCVSYTTDVHEGSKAALIYLSGCGDGYANTSGSYVGGAMVGSLFIGTYNSGIIQGHSFDSRPSSLSFWYKYKPYNSDAFKVVVSLKNGDTEIATGTYEPSAYSAEDNVYKQATVNFNYTDNTAKATTICVQFLASNKTSLSGNDFAWGTNINYPTIGNWTVHMGSVLKIDDLCLNYDK